jgi:hypothetical protein
MGPPASGKHMSNSSDETLIGLSESRSERGKIQAAARPWEAINDFAVRSTQAENASPQMRCYRSPRFSYRELALLALPANRCRLWRPSGCWLIRDSRRYGFSVGTSRSFHSLILPILGDT